MKKGIILLLILSLCASLSVVFAAGGQEAEAAAAVDEVDPSGQTVTFWYQHSRSREEAMQKIIADFNSTNEWGITVQGEYAGGYSDIYNKMITAIAGGGTPDLVVAYQNQAAGYQVADALVNLTPYVMSDKYGLGDEEDDYFEGFLNSDINNQFGGERLGFPPNRSLEVLYYNKTWLNELGYDAPPVDWDEFAEMCKAAAASGDDKYGYAIRTDASNVFAMAISRGATIEADDGAGYTFNIPEVADSFALMKELLDSGAAIRISEAYGDQTDFGNSKILFTMGSTSGLPYYESAVQGSENPFEWSVAAIPHTTRKPAMDVYGASVSVTKSTPEKQLASWLFLKYYTSVEAQDQWVRASNYFPVRKSVAANLSDYFAENPKYETAFNILNTSDLMGEPPFSGYDEVRDAAAAAFIAALDGGDIDSILEDLDEEANQIHLEASPE